MLYVLVRKRNYEWKYRCVGNMIDPLDQLLDAAESDTQIITDRTTLHFTYMPDTILHRDAEQKQVAQMLLPILRGSRPSNLLVYGKPGTGKTLVVRRVISKIQERAKNSKFPILLIYSNAKEETTLGGLLVSLGKQLGMNPKQLPFTGLAISEIFKRILVRIDSEKLNVIFVVDEIDHLAQLVERTGKDVLYQLTRANERLSSGTTTLVGISNNLSFKENLDARVISSLADEEIVFPNYTTEQIKKILEERISTAFTPDSVAIPALNLCAALAGSEHGDARRAIDLIRVAGEMAEREQADIVTAEHVREASKKMEEDKELTSLRSYPLHEKLVVLAVMNADGASTGEIYTHYKSLCKSVATEPLTQRRITQILSEIELSGMISGRIIHQGKRGRTKKHKLTVSHQTVKTAFVDDITLSDIL